MCKNFWVSHTTCTYASPPNQKRNLNYFFRFRYILARPIIGMNIIWISVILTDLHKVHVQKFLGVAYHMYLCQPPQPKAEFKIFFQIQIHISRVYNMGEWHLDISYTHRLAQGTCPDFLGSGMTTYLDSPPPPGPRKKKVADSCRSLNSNFVMWKNISIISYIDGLYLGAQVHIGGLIWTFHI